MKNHFVKKEASESLVIGIFGEWGSGKSNLLQLVHEAFKSDAANASPPPVVVVPFNPWRYEKEEHLLVPLLKTMQQAVLTYLKENQSFLEKIGLSAESPKRIARFFGVSALAFAKALKLKGSVPGVGDVEFSFKEFIEKGAEGCKDKPVPPELLDTLESYYFEFEKKLRETTTGEDSIRLLFLIDDLDRCLPEKAVEMLESIKLFLDVEGCAFVLAVDDEVVERGIIHRYKEYIFLGAQQGVGHKSLAQMPITGTEYLEKIIQLPFRLPLPAKHEVRAFLRKEFSELFGQAPHDAKSVPELGQREAGVLRGGLDGEELLRLFVDHIPPVPRKQRRAAELLLLQLDMAAARGCAAQIKPLPLAKLILLQLFAPDLYRFGRRRHTGFMRNLQEWAKTHPDWERNIENFAKSLEASINALQGDQKALELRLLDRLYKPLIEALESAAHNRSGFDPFRLIREMPFASEDLLDLHRYFSFVDDGAEAQQGGNGAQMAQAGGSVEMARHQTSFSNPGEFLDLLFSTSEANWQSAAQLPEVVGRELDGKTFAAVLERLGKDEFKGLLKKRSWLGNLLPLLNLQQFQQLADKADITSQLSTDQWEESGKLLAAMRPEQRGVLQEAVSALQQKLLTQCQDAGQAVPQRAQAGWLLGDSGWLPDNLDAMVKIKAGPFLRGDEKEQARIKQDYWIAKYPVTNAQYRRFIEAKGYETADFWSQEGWAWREKEGILIPSYWDDRKYANPLSPVVGVSFYEAEAYCRWLGEQVRTNPQAYALSAAGAAKLTCRLPSNDEWERAARGTEGRKYPWGEEFAVAKANSTESWSRDEGELQGTTAGVTFPQGQRPEE
ncbi:MAG: SUMF1/EgtB/PvdO family nonheme iron enzyme, partial [Rhodocyclales bacterium]|nr:SUMF1/EgtB/PvdO family nonheme iron enzyme [Rhodocyclales bacterium]